MPSFFLPLLLFRCFEAVFFHRQVFEVPVLIFTSKVFLSFCAPLSLILYFRFVSSVPISVQVFYRGFLYSDQIGFIEKVLFASRNILIKFRNQFRLLACMLKLIHREKRPPLTFGFETGFSYCSQYVVYFSFRQE